MAREKGGFYSSPSPKIFERKEKEGAIPSLLKETF